MTSKNRSFRPSPAMIVACVALLLALTGSAIAAGVAKNSVRSAQIVDATVRTVDLRDNAVNSAKIAPDAVGSEEIAENAVSSPEVAPDSLTAGDLGPASVTSSEVADQSLTADDLGPDSVGSSELQAGAVRSSELGPIISVSNSTPVAAGANASVTATCPAGTTVISGGAQPANFGVELTSTLRNGNGWLAQAKNNNGAASTLTAFAYCLTGGSSN
jgi:trimeric autotransporter adhesin